MPEIDERAYTPKDPVVLPDYYPSVPLKELNTFVL